MQIVHGRNEVFERFQRTRKPAQLTRQFLSFFLIVPEARGDLQFVNFVLAFLLAVPVKGSPADGR